VAPVLARPALAGMGSGTQLMPVRSRLPALPQRRQRRTIWTRLAAVGSRRGVGLALTILLLGGSSLFGAVRGGQYETFVAEYGSPLDFVARSIGFGLDAVTISGTQELTSAEILDAAGLNSSTSLLFLDAAAVRDKLKAVPLIQDASVRKFYPDRLLIEITERVPFALWQHDGALTVVSADGKAIQDGSDGRFTKLPFVVGKGAETRVDEFLKILDAADDMRSQVRAGILVGERRWTLKLTNGMDVKLPEKGAEAAVAQIAKLAREARLLDKDLLIIDARLPGRLIVRLSVEAAAAKADATARRKPKGSPV
jgi:cell division protein FtsQ